MGFLSFAVPLIAAVFLIADELMNKGHSIPRFDVLLAGATATPAAVHMAAEVTARPLFTTPIFHFALDGSPVFLTIPDCMALIASAIMVTRFLAWAVAPLRKGGGDD